MSTELSLEQRRVGNTVMVQLCRGFYDDCLTTIRNNTSLPPVQGEILENIVRRMMSLGSGETMPQDHLNAIAKNRSILEELNKHGHDPSIPESVLVNIYDRAMELSFENFRTHLMEAQSAEHSKINQTLILCNSCTNLMLAQRKIERIGRSVYLGVNETLFILYVMVFVFTAIFIHQQY